MLNNCELLRITSRQTALLLCQHIQPQVSQQANCKRAQLTSERGLLRAAIGPASITSTDDA